MNSLLRSKNLSNSSLLIFFYITGDSLSSVFIFCLYAFTLCSLNKC